MEKSFNLIPWVIALDSTELRRLQTLIVVSSNPVFVMELGIECIQARVQEIEGIWLNLQSLTTI